MIKLYISTFNKPIDWIHERVDIKFVQPIEVGADCRDQFVYELKDNTGDNISWDNALWGELTGLYWIWRNVKFSDDDIIGFAHYSKIIDIQERTIHRLFEANQQPFWIVKRPFTMCQFSYKGKVGKELSIIEDVLKKDYPEYYKTWQELYDDTGMNRVGIQGANDCQMFYASSAEFKNYCDFLFSVMFKVREMCGDGDQEIPPYFRRYCALLGDRLLSVYLKTRKINFKEFRAYTPDITLLRRIKDDIRYYSGVDKTRWYKQRNERKRYVRKDSMWAINM